MAQNVHCYLRPGVKTGQNVCYITCFQDIGWLVLHPLVQTQLDCVKPQLQLLLGNKVSAKHQPITNR